MRRLALPLVFALHGMAHASEVTPTATGWRDAGFPAVRGMTIGPIENAYHPGKGYGSAAYERTLDETRALGASWIAITPFGRVADLSGTGVDLTFEASFEKNRADIGRAIDQAHARGLKVMLVPHLWVESGAWRAEIDPKTDAGWARWTTSYGAFIETWARVAADHGADMLSAEHPAFAFERALSQAKPPE